MKIQIYKFSSRWNTMFQMYEIIFCVFSHSVKNYTANYSHFFFPNTDSILHKARDSTIVFSLSFKNHAYYNMLENNWNKKYIIMPLSKIFISKNAYKNHSCCCTYCNLLQGYTSKSPIVNLFLRVLLIVSKQGPSGLVSCSFCRDYKQTHIALVHTKVSNKTNKCILVYIIVVVTYILIRHHFLGWYSCIDTTDGSLVDVQIVFETLESTE